MIGTIRAGLTIVGFPGKLSAEHQGPHLENWNSIFLGSHDMNIFYSTRR